MPAVARELGAATTSVYWHFRTRDHLLVAVTESITAKLYERLPEIDTTRPWAEEAFDYFCALRQELNRQPTYLALFSTRARFLFSRGEFSASLLTRLEQGVELFTQTGATAAEAARSFMSCEAFVRGFCMLEGGLLHEQVPPAGFDVSGVVARLSPEQFPMLSQLGDFERVMWLDDAKFELGLRSLLDGFARQAGSMGRSRALRRSRGV